MGTQQILLLSDMTYLDKFVLGPINRDVDPSWVNQLKEVMKHKILKKHEKVNITE